MQPLSSGDSIDTATPAVNAIVVRKNEIEYNVFLKSKKGCLLLLLFSIFNVANQTHTPAHAPLSLCCRVSHFRRLFRRSLFIYRFSKLGFCE